MKKITIFLFFALCGVLGFNAQAQALGQATVIEPQGKYVTYLNELIITWGEDVEMIDPIEDSYGDYCIPVTITGFGEESTVYFSYVKEWDNSSWQYVDIKSQLSARVLNFCQDPVTWGWKNGEVTVTLPEGVVKNAAGKTNAAQTFEFNLMGAIYDEYTVEPADNSFVNPSSFNEVTITFEGTVAPFDTTQPITIITNESTIEVPEENLTFDSNTLTIKTGEQKVGDIYLTIPANYVVVTDSEGKQLINNPINLHYKVWDGLSSLELIYPTGYSITSLDKPIEMTWNCEITLNEGVVPTINIYFTDIVDEPVPTSSLTITDQVLNLDLSYLTGKVPSGTVIDITIPEGLVSGDEGINPGQKLSINYYEPYGNETKFELKENQLYIGWDGVSYLETNYKNSLYLVNPDGSKRELTWSYNDMPGEVKVAKDGPYAYAGLDVDLAALNVDPGDYTLVLPEGIFFIYSSADYSAYANPGAEYKFTWDGEAFSSVKNIVDSNFDGVYRVYNLQGINVLNTTDVNVLKTLKGGVYIVNGKKIVIRN